MMAVIDFDPITTTAAELQNLMQDHVLTSVEVILTYLTQIERHNRKGRQLRAILSVAPRDQVLDIAHQLDEERQQGKVRGPLHGIPIVVMDNIVTDSILGMETTVGCPALTSQRAKKNASVVDKLMEAGLIVLAKANLSEFCGFKCSEMPQGWSAVGGQVKSPYVVPARLEKGNMIWDHSEPGGSSAGAAVSVAAGFCPLALGLDSLGSLITPANSAALYALKPTIGDVNMDGAFVLMKGFDNVGGMAKSATDLASLMDIIMEPWGRPQEFLPQSPTSGRRSWRGLRVGFADPSTWKIKKEVFRTNSDAEKYMKGKYAAVIAKIQEMGASVTYPVAIPPPDTLEPDEERGFNTITRHEFQGTIAEFLGNFEDSNMQSLEDIIEFNINHPHFALPSPVCPNQEQLENALHTEPSEDEVAEFVADLRRLGGKEGLDAVFEEHALDLIAAPDENTLCSIAAAAGYPTCSVPLGALKYHGRPFGLCIVARAHHEADLLQFMAAYESSFPQRAIPLPLEMVPLQQPDELLPDGPVIKVILNEWDSREWQQSSDAFTNWLNARWRKSGYAVSHETTYELLKNNGRIAYRGLGDVTDGMFAR